MWVTGNTATVVCHTYGRDVGHVTLVISRTYGRDVGYVTLVISHTYGRDVGHVTLVINVTHMVATAGDAASLILEFSQDFFFCMRQSLRIDTNVFTVLTLSAS